jgi:GTP-binding protein
MLIKNARFMGSFSQLDQCPTSNLPEYAFTGRSNVGKSSLINSLTGQKHLAKTSSTPGKTRLINYFLINEDWHLVDLPGYGYARASRENKRLFDAILTNYTLQRTSLTCLFVLIDCRHAPLANDLDFIHWLGENGIPFVITFTKSDKLTVPKLESNINSYKIELLKTWEQLPQIFVTSSANNSGTEEILKFIDKTNKKVNISQDK